MDKVTEDLKRMFYQVALATEKKRSQLEQLRALGEKMAKAAALVLLIGTCARAEQIIHLKDDGTYIRTSQFLKAVSIAEGSIQEAVELGKNHTTIYLRHYDELEADKVANLLEDNGYELDEEARLLNPLVLRVSWEPFVSPDKHNKAVTDWYVQEHQREMRSEAGQ